LIFITDAEAITERDRSTALRALMTVDEAGGSENSRTRFVTIDLTTVWMCAMMCVYDLR